MLLLNFRQSSIHTYTRTHRKIVGEIVGETGASCTECLLEKQTNAMFEVGQVTVLLHSCIPHNTKNSTVTPQYNAPRYNADRL